MIQKTTNNINIKAHSEFSSIKKGSSEESYIFKYTITIENLGNCSVRLISREWLIFDTAGFHQEVVGDGVAGIQPMLMPQESYQYTSYASIQSELGRMNGKYIFRNQENGDLFDVIIPQFDLIVPFKLN